MFRYHNAGNNSFKNFKKYDIISTLNANLNSIMEILNTQYENIYNRMEEVGISRNVAEGIFKYVINFTLYNADKNLSSDEIISMLERQVPWYPLMLRQLNINYEEARNVLLTVIDITLSELAKEGQI